MANLLKINILHNSTVKFSTENKKTPLKGVFYIKYIEKTNLG